MASAAALPKFPSRRSATRRVPQIRVLPAVSRAEAAAGVPSLLMYISTCGPLIHRPLVPFTLTSVTWPAKRGRYQDGEGDLAAGLRQRHLLLAGQGGTACRGPRRAWLLAKLNAGEPEHADDRRTTLRGRDQDSKEGHHHHQCRTPSQPALVDTRPRGRPAAAPDSAPFEPLPHGCGGVAGRGHLKLAARGPQLGLHRALPLGSVSHWRPGSAPRA